MKLAVIPARGGSKRIPRKNVREFCGKPIIAYSIEAALQSRCFDRIIVSTDDAEIATVARALGAETPFVRPPALSDDHATTIPVIRHAIEWFGEQGMQPELVCCIYATAPFVRTEDLLRGLDVLNSSDCDYAFPVTTYPFPIQRAIRIDAQDRVEMFDPKHFNTRSQDLEEAYHDAGQFYWGRAAAWLSGKPIFDQHSRGIRIPRYRVQDIDTIEDWQMAENLFRAGKLGSSCL